MAKVKFQPQRHFTLTAMNDEAFKQVKERDLLGLSGRNGLLDSLRKKIGETHLVNRYPNQHDYMVVTGKQFGLEEHFDFWHLYSRAEQAGLQLCQPDTGLWAALQLPSRFGDEITVFASLTIDEHVVTVHSNKVGSVASRHRAIDVGCIRVAGSRPCHPALPWVFKLPDRVGST